MFSFQGPIRRRTKRKAVATTIRNIFGNAIIDGNEPEISDLEENSDTEDTNNSCAGNSDDLSDDDSSHNDSDNESETDEGVNEEASRSHRTVQKKEDFGEKIPDPILSNFSVDFLEENLQNTLSCDC